ncbi:hypothetical protein OXPF_12780 [Oxobacter pfennigii]|uniref:Uncharacterized protein n=1 Tax=Oxobacter pfennigii TaxID=36849 RepID=A0A0P8X2Y8_9CLOT|nr:hypothetical protein OXPF_12780 [Oxobacter pfennigii]
MLFEVDKYLYLIILREEEERCQKKLKNGQQIY